MVLFGCNRKENFPARPITLICPWAVGGGTDRISRKLAFLLERDLSVPVNVINATGGGGVTGHTRGARVRPDGYTMTVVTVELNMLHWRSLTNISYKNFKPVMMVNQDAAALFVRADSQWKNLKDLEQTIRENPGKLKSSGTAFGGIWHVALTGWLTRIGLKGSDVTWINMAGAGPSLQELMAKGLDIVVCSLPEAQILLNSEKIRCLGVMNNQRLPVFPDVPTFKELGVDWQISSYRGIVLPLGVPESRFMILEEAVAKAAKSEEYLEYLRSTGSGATAMPSNEFSQFLAKTDETFGEIFAEPSFKNLQHKYGPMLFPTILFVLFVICFVICYASGSLRTASDKLGISITASFDIFLFAGSAVLFLLTAETLGFIFSTILILLILFWRMRLKWIISIPVAIFLTIIVFQIFAIYLRVPLPRGLFGW